MYLLTGRSQTARSCRSGPKKRSLLHGPSNLPHQHTTPRRCDDAGAGSGPQKPRSLGPCHLSAWFASIRNRWPLQVSHEGYVVRIRSRHVGFDDVDGYRYPITRFHDPHRSAWSVSDPSRNRSPLPARRRRFPLLANTGGVGWCGLLVAAPLPQDATPHRGRDGGMGAHWPQQGELKVQDDPTTQPQTNLSTGHLRKAAIRNSCQHVNHAPLYQFCISGEEMRLQREPSLPTVFATNLPLRPALPTTYPASISPRSYSRCVYLQQGASRSDRCRGPLASHLEGLPTRTGDGTFEITFPSQLIPRPRCAPAFTRNK